MKHLFENWRKYLRESETGMREFVFSESELVELNRSISKIVSAARSILGADGPSPMLRAKNLEKIKIEYNDEKKFINGVTIPNFDLKDARYRIFNKNNNFVGIGEIKKNSLKHKQLV